MNKISLDWQQYVTIAWRFHFLFPMYHIFILIFNPNIQTWMVFNKGFLINKFDKVILPN